VCIRVHEHVRASASVCVCVGVRACAHRYLVDDGLVGQRARVKVKCPLCRQLGVLLSLHSLAQHKQLTLQLIAHQAGLATHQDLHAACVYVSVWV